MANRLMIDIRQVKAQNESYLKERWIRMNWRKNYREKLAQKVKFRQDEIDQAQIDMNGEKVEDIENVQENQTVPENGPNSGPEVSITIPTDSCVPEEPIAAKESDSRPLTAKSTTSSDKVASKKAENLSRKSSIVSSSTSSLSSSRSHHSVPIKPVELIRSQLSSANSQRKSSTSSIRPKQRAKSAYIPRKNQVPESIVLSGKRIPLTDRDTLWKSSVHVNKTTPEASKTYLNARKGVAPEQKYDFPHVSSFDYGWRLSDRIASYKPPLYGRSQTIQATFYRGSGVLRPQHALY